MEDEVEGRGGEGREGRFGVWSLKDEERYEEYGDLRNMKVGILLIM